MTLLGMPGEQPQPDRGQRRQHREHDPRHRSLRLRRAGPVEERPDPGAPQQHGDTARGRQEAEVRAQTALSREPWDQVLGHRHGDHLAGVQQEHQADRGSQRPQPGRWIQWCAHRDQPEGAGHESEAQRQRPGGADPSRPRGDRELEQQDRHRRQDEQPAQRPLAPGGPVQLHRQGEVELVVAQQVRAVADREEQEGAIAHHVPPSGEHRLLAAVLGAQPRRQQQDVGQQDDGEDARSDHTGDAERDREQDGPESRAGHRAHLARDRVQREHLGPGDQPGCLQPSPLVGERGLHGRREQRGREADEHGPGQHPGQRRRHSEH